MGRPPLYPWDLWLDGERHVLNSVEHFRCDVRSMQIQTRTEARKRKIEVTTRVKVNPAGDGVDYLEVRAPVRERKRLAWDQMLSDLPKQLIRGRDFDCALDSMRTRVYDAARRREMELHTRLDRTYGPGDTMTESIWLYADTPATEMAPAEEES